MALTVLARLLATAYKCFVGQGQLEGAASTTTPCLERPVCCGRCAKVHAHQHLKFEAVDPERTAM